MAAEFSPGRKPGDQAVLELRALEEGDRILGTSSKYLSPLRGSDSFCDRYPGLAPGAKLNRSLTRAR